MIIKFLNHKIKINQLIEEKQNITTYTPQINFIQAHKSDISKEMGSVRSIINSINYSPRIIWDLMAGCGFTSWGFKDRWPNAKYLLNDLSPVCFQILKDNFPQDEIQNNYAHLVKYKSLPDLISVDFNNFTLKRFKENEIIFDFINKVNPKWFLFADSVSYSFKFNCLLSSYEVVSKEDYYQLLSNFLYKKYNWIISKVCIFGNAAIIACNKSHSGKINFLDFKSIPFIISKNIGLGL